MALWGNKDSVYSAGTVDVNLGTNTVTGTSGVVTFTSAVSEGDVITVGAGATYGYAVITGVFGVDYLEVGVAATTAYAVGHSGWVGVTTYIDCHGSLRVKHEVLVAGGILTTTDAADDALFPES